MSVNLNKVLIGGKLTRDIETRQIGSGSTVANFGVAINRKYKSGTEWKSDVTFLDCEAWGKTAETMSKYLSKGSGVFLEGRLKRDDFQDAQGNKRTAYKVVVENFQFTDSKGASSAAPANDGDDIPF